MNKEFRCDYCNKLFDRLSSKVCHEKYCIQNPNHLGKGYDKDKKIIPQLDANNELIYKCEWGKEFKSAAALGGHCSKCEIHLKHKPKTNKNKHYKLTPPGKCQYCAKECKNQNSLRQHEIICEANPNRITKEQKQEIYKNMPQESKDRMKWSKGKTKENCKGIAKQVATYLRNEKLGLHKHLCGEDNPAKRPEIRKKISKTCIQNVKLGKHNVWKPREDHSYPEKWLIKVLKNNFNQIENKDYQTEYKVGTKYLDFAWPEYKIAIEIDGEQHYKDKNQINSDIKKDKLLKSKGWLFIRLPWKYIIKNKSKVIDIINQFIYGKDSIGISRLNRKWIATLRP